MTTRNHEQEPASPSAWISSIWPATLIACLIIAGSLGFMHVLRDREISALESLTVTATAAAVDEIENRMLDQVGSLERLASNWKTRGGLSRDEFELVVSEIAHEHSFIQAIEWADAGSRVRWVVPVEGNEAALGLDLGFDERRRAAIEVSSDERAPTISRPLQLVQGGLGFIVLVPLEVDGRFDGFVLAVYRAYDLFSGVLENVAFGFGIRIADEEESLYRRGDSDAAWTHARSLQARRIPRAWSIEVAPRPEVVDISLTQLPFFVAGSGAVLALGFAITAQLARSRRLRNRQLASEVKRRLNAERELARVINSHPDHVWSAEITPAGFETIYYSPVLERITRTPGGTYKDSLEAWYATVHEDDVDRLRRVNDELLKGKRNEFEIEYRVRRGDGTLAWLRDRVKSTPTERGRRLDGVTSDITEARHAEAERLRNEKEKLLLVERERIVREMHDGLGGQLVSAIAMVERGRGSDREVTEALRSALDDLRIAIDSLDPTTTDLTTSLGKLRARLEPLLRRNGVTLHWSVENLPGLDEFPPGQTLHLVRIIQESVTNALRHAKAREVSVCVGADDTDDDVMWIRIRDDGCGFRPDTAHSGRGIGNMKSRADELGADLRFDVQESGTLVELRVPMPRPNIAADANAAVPPRRVF